MTATPNSGYNFVNWTEGGTEVSNSVSYTFTLGTTDRTLVANFMVVAPVPIIESVALNPVTHTAGTAQAIQVTVVTLNTVDNTVVTSTLVDGQGGDMIPSISDSGTINGNMAVLTLNVGAGVPAGNYQVKVEAAGVAGAAFKPYVITDAASPLAVSLTDPPDNAAGISINTDIVITFNRSVQESVYFGDITISGGGSVIGYVYGINAGTLTLDPSRDLEYSTLYTVAIPAGAVKDSDGNILAAEYTFRFTSGNRPSGGGGVGVSAPQKSIITNVVETADDKALDKLLIDKDKAVLSLMDNGKSSADISADVIKKLAENNKPFTVENTGIKMDFAPESLNTELVTGKTAGKAVVEIGAREVSGEEKNELLAKTPPGESTGLFEIGGRVFDLTTLLKRTNVDGSVTTERIEKFGQPVAVTIDLSHLGELTQEQIDQLTGVRLEIDEKGNVVPVSLGGKYDPDTKTFTFHTDRFSLYTVMAVGNKLLQIKLTIGSTVATVNGKDTNLDVSPVLVNGRTLVPVRFIAECMGARVDWSDEVQTVEIALDGRKLSLVIGQARPEAGLDVPAVIISGRTLVPLRYVSESFEASVKWLPETRCVEIEYVLVKKDLR